MNNDSTRSRSDVYKIKKNGRSSTQCDVNLNNNIMLVGQPRGQRGGKFVFSSPFSLNYYELRDK